MDVEKLIECVRAHVCLYDLSHKQYKKTVLKNALWESIGRELNQSGEAVKQKWKTIRDGYTKYKKQVKGTTGSGRRNVNYTWASQLAFLDHFNVPRECHTNVPAEVVLPSPPSPRSESPGHFDSMTSQSPVPSTSSQILPPESQSSSPPPQAAPPSSEVPSQSQIPNSGASISRASSRNAKRPSGHAGSEDDVGRVLQFLNSKKRKELDVTDNLFLSYADTFKKFPPREQAIVKLELAKLFSNIELRLLDPISDNSQSQYISIASPAYSTISLNSSTLQEIESPTQSQPINLSGENNASVVEDSSSLQEQLLNCF